MRSRELLAAFVAFVVVYFGAHTAVAQTDIRATLVVAVVTIGFAAFAAALVALGPDGSGD